MRTRARVVRGTGALQVADAPKGDTCRMCNTSREVRFVRLFGHSLAAGPRRMNTAGAPEPKNVYFNICASCGEILYGELSAMRAGEAGDERMGLASGRP